MEVSYMNLVSDSKECYKKIHKYFHKLNELYDSKNELFTPIRISITVDILIQYILLNMAGDDSQCSQLEVAYISNFCDYANLASMAKVEWATFTRLDQTSLRNFLDSISGAFLSNETKPYFVKPFSMIDRDYDGNFLLNIRKKLKKIFHNLCLINGDNPSSFGYERAIKIGKDLFDNLVGRYWENEL